MGHGARRTSRPPGHPDRHLGARGRGRRGDRHRAPEPPVPDGVTLPTTLRACDDLAVALEGVDVVVTAVPVQHLRATLTGVAPLRDAPVVVTVSTGIEAGTRVTPHRILADVGVPSDRLTCAGPLSRNRAVGLAIGRGRKLAEVRAEMHEVAEGLLTCRSAAELAARLGVETPITEQMYLLLFEDKDPTAAIRDLIGRDLRDEREHDRQHDRG